MVELPGELSRVLLAQIKDRGRQPDSVLVEDDETLDVLLRLELQEC